MKFLKVPLLSILALVSLVGVTSYCNKHTVRPGQVWVFAANDLTPPMRETNTIISVRSGVVVYESISMTPTGLVTNRSSAPIDYFVVSSTRIK